MSFKAKAACRCHIPKQQHRVTNGAAYDAGLRARGILTVWFTPEAIEAWRAEPRTGRGGQPRYSSLAIMTALSLQAVFRLALRQAKGLIGSILAIARPRSRGARPFAPEPSGGDIGYAAAKGGQRDRHIEVIAEHGRMAWQKAFGYNWRALVEVDISRGKRVIGDEPRLQTEGRQATEVAIAASVLNRMLELGRPEYVRIV